VFDVHELPIYIIDKVWKVLERVLTDFVEVTAIAVTSIIKKDIWSLTSIPSTINKSLS